MFSFNEHLEAWIFGNQQGNHHPPRGIANTLFINWCIEEWSITQTMWLPPSISPNN